MYRRFGLFLDNRYGSGSGPIWIKYLYCADDAVSLSECAGHAFSNDFFDCAHDEDVSIACDDGIGKC